MAISAERVMLGLFLCASLLVFEGCHQRLGDFTVLSTKNVDVSGLKEGERLSGEHCINRVLGFPIGQLDWKTAMDRALEKGKGNLMVDVVVSFTSWTAILFAQDCVVIEGTVARTAS